MQPILGEMWRVRIWNATEIAQSCGGMLRKCPKKVLVSSSGQSSNSTARRTGAGKSYGAAIYRQTSQTTAQANGSSTKPRVASADKLNWRVSHVYRTMINNNCNYMHCNCI